MLHQRTPAVPASAAALCISTSSSFFAHSSSASPGPFRPHINLLQVSFLLESSFSPSGEKLAKRAKIEASNRDNVKIESGSDKDRTSRSSEHSRNIREARDSVDGKEGRTSRESMKVETDKQIKEECLEAKFVPPKSEAVIDSREHIAMKAESSEKKERKKQHSKEKKKKERQKGSKKKKKKKHSSSGKKRKCDSSSSSGSSNYDSDDSDCVVEVQRPPIKVIPTEQQLALAKLREVLYLCIFIFC
jgi:hypothetical protein